MMAKPTTKSKSPKRPPRQGVSTEEDERPRTKQQKTDDFCWCDGKVSYKDLPSFAGIVAAGKFERTQDQISIEDIKNLIKDTAELNVPGGNSKMFFYKGFKTALDDLLTDIGNASHKILLIHGVPQMGKSSLARCLAYYLALEGDSAAYVRMACTPELDSEVAVNSLSSYFYRARWVILDQCNVNCLRETHFLQCALAREKTHTGEDPKMPLIMFTSGYYAPQSWWMENSKIEFKVINMCVNEAVVDDLKKFYDTKKEVYSKDVLKVSTIFGHVSACLCHSERLRPEEVSFETLQETVYQLRDIETLSRRSEFFWLLWPQFAQVTSEEIEANNEPEDWKIEPYKVQYLGRLLTGISDPRDHNTNMVINWLNISGEKTDKEKEADAGYCTYKANSYFYYFPHLQMLHSIIVKAFDECTPERLYAAYLDVYNKVEQIYESNAQSLRGMLFKNLVRLVCDIQVPKSQKGLCIHGEFAGLIPVNKVCHVSDVDDLCENAVEIFKKEKTQSLWCILNAPGAVQFAAYDFAFVSATSNLKFIQLLQVTINSVSHDKESMNNVLDKVKDKCKSYNATVDGYFLVPKGLSPPKGSSGGFSVAVLELPGQHVRD